MPISAPTPSPRGSERDISKATNSFSAVPLRLFSGLLKDQWQWPVYGSSLCLPCRLYLSEAYGFSCAASRLPRSCPQPCRTCVCRISSSQPFLSLPDLSGAERNAQVVATASRGNCSRNPTKLTLGPCRKVQSIGHGYSWECMVSDVK